MHIILFWPKKRRICRSLLSAAFWTWDVIDSSSTSLTSSNSNIYSSWSSSLSCLSLTAENQDGVGPLLSGLVSLPLFSTLKCFIDGIDIARDIANRTDGGLPSSHAVQVRYTFHLWTHPIDKNSPCCIKIVGVLSLQYLVCDGLLVSIYENLSRHIDTILTGCPTVHSIDPWWKWSHSYDFSLPIGAAWRGDKTVPGEWLRDKGVATPN